MDYKKENGAIKVLETNA
uniref:Uncharacterized protein n=1 Tax=Rhizophora mucronata TaxID=61149 RepID=A0A2P2QY20_RHIMU